MGLSQLKIFYPSLIRELQNQKSTLKCKIFLLDSCKSFLPYTFKGIVITEMDPLNEHSLLSSHEISRYGVVSAKKILFYI